MLSDAFVTAIAEIRREREQAQRLIASLDALLQVVEDIQGASVVREVQAAVAAAPAVAPKAVPPGGRKAAQAALRQVGVTRHAAIEATRAVPHALHEGSKVATVIPLIEASLRKQPMYSSDGVVIRRDVLKALNIGDKSAQAETWLTAVRNGMTQMLRTKRLTRKGSVWTLGAAGGNAADEDA